MSSPDPLLRITVETVEEARLVRVAGELDRSTASKLRHHIQVARELQLTLLLDLADVDFMDAGALRVLLDASRRAVRTGWPFFIVRPSGAVQRLVALTATERDLPLVQTKDRVLA